MKNFYQHFAWRRCYRYSVNLLYDNNRAWYGLFFSYSFGMKFLQNFLKSLNITHFHLKNGKIYFVYEKDYQNFLALLKTPVYELKVDNDKNSNIWKILGTIYELAITIYLPTLSKVIFYRLKIKDLKELNVVLKLSGFNTIDKYQGRLFVMNSVIVVGA